MDAPLLAEPRRRRRGVSLRSACGWTAVGLVALSWLAGNYVVIRLQMDKSDMTILNKEQLRDAFFGLGLNDTLAPTEQWKKARHDSSRIYNWLIHGSPKQVVPWDELTGDDSGSSWLNRSLYASGHCSEAKLALLAEGKIDEEACGNWARPRSDGCAGGFYEAPSLGGGGDDDSSSEGNATTCPGAARPARSCEAGTFCPEGLTCFVACLYGASCGVSTLRPGEDECAWAVDTKHASRRAYERDGRVVCPGVAYEILCPAGYYCADPTVVPAKCPRSHYCPEGSYSPRHCPFFTQCNREGLEAPDIHVAAAAALLGFFAFVLILVQSSKFVQRRLRRIQEAVKERRQLRREQALERRAAALASRAMQQDDDHVLYRVPSTSSDDDGALELPPHLTASTSAPSAAAAAASRASLGGMLRSLKPKSEGELVDLEFERLGLVVHASNGRPMRVLEGVAGGFRSGTVSAIMGPSGAGKSTLLKVLCGRVDRATEAIAPGSVIKVNGDETISLQSLAPLCALVPQEDVMHRELSVSELLEFSAATRLAQDRRGRVAVVRDVISALGLQRVKDAVVGDAVKRGISGGQRKRVNLALELCADPCVLFADEVTSGLDSATSLDVVQVLHALADKGANVVVVLHQPSLAIFDSFTSVLLLAPGGRTAFLGPPKAARRHFERLDFKCPPDWSPPDYYMQLLSTSTLRVDLAAEWSRSAVLRSDDNDRSSAAASREAIEEAARDRAPPPWLAQLALQFARALLRHRRVAWSIAGDAAVQALAGGGIGLLYTDYAFKNAQLVNFMVSIALGMTLTLAAVPTLGAKSSRAVFLRECCNAGGGGLSPSAYFVAANLADLPRFAALAACFCIAFYPLAHPRASLGVYVIAASADAFAASGFGYVCGATFDEQTAQLAALCVALVFGMFSGVHPTITQMQVPLRAIHYSSHDRYFVEVLFLEEVTHMSEAFRMPPSFYASPSSSVLAQLLAYGYLIVDVSAYWANHYIRWLDLATLFAIGLAARALAYCCLIQFNQAALCREPLWVFAGRAIAPLVRARASLCGRRVTTAQRPWRFSPLHPPSDVMC